MKHHNKLKHGEPKESRFLQHLRCIHQRKQYIYSIYILYNRDISSRKVKPTSLPPILQTPLASAESKQSNHRPQLDRPREGIDGFLRGDGFPYVEKWFEHTRDAYEVKYVKVNLILNLQSLNLV